MAQRFHIFLIIAVAAFFYVATMPYTITLEDAGLFQMVCHLGGISHPPGYPLFTLLCNQLTVFPHLIVGNLISVLFALATLIVFYKIVILLTYSEATALVAALAYGFSACFWSQAIIIEVYSLAALMFMICWWLLLKFAQTSNVRYWYFLCLAAGLALSNHWPLFVLSALGFVSILGSVRVRLWRCMADFRFWLISFLLFITGLLPYLSLLLNTDPEIAIFGPVIPETFWDYVTRSYYSDNRAGAVLEDKLMYFVWLISESGMQLGLVGLPVIVIGFFQSFRRLSVDHAISLVLIFIASTFLLMAMLNMKFEILYQAVFKPYPVIAYSALALWFSIGTQWLVNLLPAKKLRWKQPVAVLLLFSIVVSNYADINRNTDLVDEYARIILESLPENSILIVNGDNQVGPIGFKNRVEKVRPDVTLYDAESLVFYNRLTEVLVSDGEVRAAVDGFIKDNERPVFTIGERVESTTSYGLYYGYNHRDAESYVFIPEFERYIDYIVTLYQAGLISDLHERQFTYNLILTFARQYARDGFERGLNNFPSERLLRLQRLQATFPGKLVTLEVIFDRGYNVDVDLLLDLLASAEEQITDQISRQDISVLYQFYGLTHLMRQEEEQAINMFKKSLEIMPSKSNKSICNLKFMYEENDDVLNTQALAAEYSLDTCQL